MTQAVFSPYQDKFDPWSSHSVIRNWLRPFPAGTRILDVGTATGTLGRMCQNSGFLITGIEPNPEWAEAAQPFYDRVVVGLLDFVPDDFIAGQDVVVLADVLEHMPDPQESLRRLVVLQQPGTCFFISVPNIANLWVRLNLLFGRFEYTDRGILDRTHLRFFTHRSFLQFLQDSGLKVVSLTVTPIPLPLVSPFFQSNSMGRFVYNIFASLTRLFPTLLGYQLVTKSEKL
jgi:2-polyprenyl-3-methyl-5-hydroxy-6-metoxy-1,4-benzoquinol methylase